MQKYFSFSNGKWNLNSQSAAPGLKMMKYPEPQEKEPLEAKNVPSSQDFEKFFKKLKQDYLWMVYEKGEYGEGIFCSICREYTTACNVYLNNLQKKFILEPSINLKTSAPIDHEKSHIHLEAFKFKHGQPKLDRKEDNQTLDNFEDRITNKIKNENIFIHFLATYFLSKEKIPLRKFPKLLEFLKQCGVEIIPHYQHEVFSREILPSLSHKITESLTTEMKSCSCLGIMIDESTDSTMIPYLVINLRYIHNFQIKENFCTLIRIETEANSYNLSSLVIDFLYNYGLQIVL